MAGRPSSVAGILMNRFGRSTLRQRLRADSMVPSVSKASAGATSIETRPSRPPERSNVSANTSQAFLTSSVVISAITSSTDAPPRVRPATWSS